MTDMINNPPHYKDESGIECIEITRHMGFCGGNCFKYLYRAGKKGDLIEDLEKAKRYAKWAHEQKDVVASCAIEDIRRVSECRDYGICEVMLSASKMNWGHAHLVLDRIIERGGVIHDFDEMQSALQNTVYQDIIYARRKETE